MSPNIQSILQDLYAIDEGLRAHEAELVPVIERLLATRPNREPDASFVRELRSQILQRFANTSAQTSSFSFISFMKSLNPRAVAIPVGLVAVLALAVMVAPKLKLSPMNLATETPTVFTSVAHVSKLASGAFGSLQNVGAAGGMGGGGNAVRSQAGGGGGSATAPMAASADAKIGIVPPYVPTAIKYVYKGELPTWEAEMAVYRRQKGMAQNGGLNSMLSLATGGLVDLSRVSGLNLQNFTMSQPGSKGYVFTVDLNESVVSINQNYPTWPHPMDDCYRAAEKLSVSSIARGEPVPGARCEEQNRVHIEQIPSDQELIKIADQFLDEYHISKDGYGAPVVNNDWRRAYDASPDKSQYYLPYSIQVIYPLSVEGASIYEEGGMLHGLSVNVNVQQKAVDGVWNLYTNSYQSSNYAAETDVKKIQEIYERGGLYGWQDPNAKTTEFVELSDAKIVLSKVWLPKQDGSGTDELLVPTLRFTVANRPANIYTPDYIMVPLIKDVLERQGGIRIMM